MQDIDLFWDTDTQVDFVDSDGALYVDGAENIRGNLARLTKLAEFTGHQRVMTGDWHTHEHEEIVESVEEADFAETFPPHCMQDERGSEFVVETQPGRPVDLDVTLPGVSEKNLEWLKEHGAQEVRIYKQRFDVFEGNPNTDDVVDVLDPEHVLVYGVSGNVCVMHAVNGLLERGCEVTIVEDAVASLPAEGGLSSWEELKEGWAEQGVEFVTTDEVMQELT